MPDPSIFLIIAVVALFAFVTFRNSKKRRSEAENLQEKVVPGAEIMTNGGIFGSIISVDDDKNIVVIESSPGVLLRIHRQAIREFIPEDVDVPEEADDDLETSSDSESPVDETEAPQFGERVEEAKKPARKNAKKTDD